MSLLRKWLLWAALAGLIWGFSASQDFTTIAAGVAIFLFGMMFLEEGFEAFTGGALERILQKSTDKLWKSEFFGFVVTALMQSSSMVSVITISFLSAGLITLTAGIGIIFGSNLGTTTGAWLMAGVGMKIDIAAFALPMIVVGLFMVYQKSPSLKGAGWVLAGVGFLFLGIGYMKDGFEAYSQTIDLTRYAMSGLKGLLVYAFIGAAATVVMQSSHATLMLTIAALAAGQLTYDNALAMAIGSNVGTTVTAVLGAMGSNIEGKRLALAHLIFNLSTAAVAIAFIGGFQTAVDWTAAHVGIAADDWTLKLAIFHTLFNVTGILLMQPLIPALVRFLEDKVKDKRTDLELQPLYLNESALELPDTAIEVLNKETLHLLDVAFELVAHGLNLHRHDILSDRDLREVVESSRESMEVDVLEGYYKRVRVLYEAIVEFASRVRLQGTLNSEQSEAVDSILLICRHVAAILKDVAELRRNVEKYMSSDNSYLREEYDRIRRYLAQFLRTIRGVRGMDDEVAIFLELEDLEERLGRLDVVAGGSLDHLVRDGLITSSMATSLINDTALTKDIARRMMAIGRRVLTLQGKDIDRLAVELLAEATEAGVR